MRHFPRAALVAVLVGGLLGSATPAVQADDRSSLEQRQSRVERQQQQARHDLQQSSEALRRADRRLGAARRELREARTELRGVQRRLGTARATHRRLAGELRRQRADLVAARIDLGAGDEAVDGQLTELRRLIVDGFESGDPRVLGVARLVSGRATLEELSRASTYDTTLTTTQDHALQELEAEQVLLAVREDDVEEITERVEAREEDAAEAVTDIRRLRREKVDARDRVRELVDERRAARQKAVRLRARDQRHLRELRREEVRLRKLALSSAAGMGNRRVRDLGRLLRAPVAAPISSPYGMRVHPIHHARSFHNGTDFAAGCGTPLLASETGKVISRYYSPVWGHRVHLSIGRVNGHGYTLVYNHLARPGRPVGSIVGRGERVGLVGSTGWSTGCHLHFTVLRDGVPVNPTRLM